MPHHIRVSNCKQHSSSIAICSTGLNLCEECTNKGYTVSGGYGFGAPPPTLYLNGTKYKKSQF
jgi:hypothetical protein